MRTSTFTRALGLGLVLSLVLALGFSAARVGAVEDRSSGEAPAVVAEKPIAHNNKGSVASRVVGTTARGQKVTGHFIPVGAVRRDGKIKMRGMINGVVHRADGSTFTFSAMRTMRVARINGTPITAGTAARVDCDILHLVLGPLDLDLLGLRIHLDRVVLDIVARSGPGNLLGNLLCAVAGILDGGLDGALRRLANLLNQILALLRLGV